MCLSRGMGANRAAPSSAVGEIVSREQRGRVGFVRARRDRGVEAGVEAYGISAAHGGLSESGDSKHPVEGAASRALGRGGLGLRASITPSLAFLQTQLRTCSNWAKLARCQPAPFCSCPIRYGTPRLGGEYRSKWLIDGEIRQRYVRGLGG